MPATWLLTWEEAFHAGPLVCGGKGWNLSRLHRYGFLVPRGGVLSADAYRWVMSLQPLREWQRGLGTAAPEEAMSPAVASTLRSVRAALMDAAFPSGLVEQLQAFLRTHELIDASLAVRSSATTEDSSTASFAGVHSSVLHVHGLDDVLRAIRTCYASLWTPQAIVYRRRLGIPEAEVASAIVLCAMITGARGGPPAGAGVAFSCDPRTGRRDRIVIEAVAGWGQDLVSGRVQPEQATFTWPRGRLTPDPAQDRGRVLTAPQAEDLARLTLRVHWALGDGQDPQDLEWVYDGTQFWLVQARPVTLLPRVTFPAVAREPIIWSNANLKEVAPGVVTALTWSLLQSALWDILYAALRAVGYPLPAGLEPIRRFAGRLYFDLSGLQWAFYDCFGLLPEEANRSLGGQQPEIRVPPGSPFAGPKGWARRWASLKLMREMWSAERRGWNRIHRIRGQAERLRSVDLGVLSKGQLFEFGHRMEEGWDFGPDFQLLNAAAGGWQGLLGRLLDRLLPGRGGAVAAAMMAGSGQVTSAEHGYQLWELARMARDEALTRAYLETEPLDPHGWRRLPASSGFRREFEAFLQAYGHRAVDELEIANPRWREDPTYLLQQIRAFLDEGDPSLARQAAQRVRQDAQEEVRRATLLWRPLIHWLASHGRRAAALREAGKSALVAMWQPMRALALEVGRRLANDGQLDRPEDVFWLAWIDLEAYLLGQWDGKGARFLAADRIRQAEQWGAEPSPDVIVQDCHRGPMSVRALGLDTKGGQQPGLRGVGVSAGRAQGPARVVRRPADGVRLRRGDILVAPTTDPAWTPLFLRAAGLVMEVGGYLSHGAIVAREYGIPAVANVVGILDAVGDGGAITVDGDTGRIWLDGAAPSDESR